MAESIDSGGVFRQSVILKSKRPIDPDKATPMTKLPPSVGSDNVTLPVTSYTDIPTNGEASKPREKEEDHYGFLYSISEKDKH